MITDKEKIRMAIAEIVSEEAYIRLRSKDFDEVCPNPDWAIHVGGHNTEDLLRQLEREMLQAGTGQLKGSVVYIRTAYPTSLRMSDLARIDAMLPQPPRCKKGLAFLPDGAGTEIWFFADEGRDNEDI